MSGVIPLRLALVGCGRLAEHGYLPALALVDQLRLVAVADPDPARRARLAGLAGAAHRPVAAHPELGGLLAAGGVDAVVLASPAPAHLPDAELAAAAGLPVLVEKPPAPDRDGAAALGRLRPAPWVGFNRRFDPGLEALRPTVPARGHVRLRIQLHYRRQTWQPVAVHDDALLDLGPHAVDLARWLTGAAAVEVVGARLTAERAELHVGLERAWAHVSLATDRPHLERYEVVDDRGHRRGRHHLGGLLAGVQGRLRPGAGPSALVISLARQLRSFAAAARGEPAPSLGTAADGLAAMEVLEAARTSAAEGGRAIRVAR